MILIVDSGSTKTDWIAMDDGGNKLFETQTLGLNPQVLTEHILEERIINNYDLYQIRKEVTKIYFYGAGCGTEPPNKLLKKVFTPIFVNADINIKEELKNDIKTTTLNTIKTLIKLGDVILIK